MGKKEKLSDKKTIKAIKHGRGNVFIWGWFSYNGVGNLFKIEEKLTGAGYVNILRNNLMPSRVAKPYF